VKNPPLPFLGVLLASDVRADPALLGPRIAASATAGIAGASFTFLCCAIASGGWSAAPLPGALAAEPVTTSRRRLGGQSARPHGPVPEILRGEMRSTKPAG
jgi:hypothetical protein